VHEKHAGGGDSCIRPRTTISLGTLCTSFGRLPSTPSPTVLSSRRVPKSERSLSMPFLFVTRLKSLVASYQTFPLHPTTTCYLGGSPRTSSVELTCLVAIRMDSRPSLEARHHRAERRDLEAPAGQQDHGWHPLRPRSWLDVPSQHPHKSFPTVSWYQALDPSGKVWRPMAHMRARCRDQSDAIIDPARWLLRPLRFQASDHWPSKVLSTSSRRHRHPSLSPKTSPSSSFLCADLELILRKRTRRRPPESDERV
jgi:hypothetical protein